MRSTESRQALLSPAGWGPPLCEVFSYSNLPPSHELRSVETVLLGCGTGDLTAEASGPPGSSREQSSLRPKTWGPRGQRDEEPRSGPQNLIKSANRAEDGKPWVAPCLGFPGGPGPGRHTWSSPGASTYLAYAGSRLRPLCFWNFPRKELCSPAQFHGTGWSLAERIRGAGLRTGATSHTHRVAQPRGAKRATFKAGGVCGAPGGRRGLGRGTRIVNASRAL